MTGRSIGLETTSTTTGSGDAALAIEAPEGSISHVWKAMKVATNLPNGYALIRPVDESARRET